MQSNKKKLKSTEWEKITKQLKRKSIHGWNNQRGLPGKMNTFVQKGMGPNKASGHKGGIGRQGSKRG